MDGDFLVDRHKSDLGRYDMFDRVINLLLWVKDKQTGREEQYAIRSDWAVYDTGSGRYAIRKCTHKPSVQVQYQKTKDDLACSVDIYVENYFLLTADGRTLAAFNKNSMELYRVDITMGYFGQFKDVPHDTAAQLLSMTPRNGASSISCRTVTYVSTDSLPPDYRLHIRCAIGDVLDAEYKEITDADTYSKAVANGYVQQLQGGDGRLLDFIKTNIMDKYKAGDGSLLYDVYGTKAVQRLNLRTLIPADEGSRPDAIVSGDFTNGCTMPQALELLKDTYRIDGLRMVIIPATEGGLDKAVFFMHDETSDIKELCKDADVKNAVKDSVFHNQFGNTLPAVDNISSDAVACITCPFFSFISPFEELYFSARYALSGVASYYLPSERSDVYYVISVKVSFATVDNVNKMEIRAIPNEKPDKVLEA